MEAGWRKILLVTQQGPGELGRRSERADGIQDSRVHPYRDGISYWGGGESWGREPGDV